MAFMIGKLARAQIENPSIETLQCWGGGGGLITAVHEKLISLDDFKALTNVRYENGALRTREGLYRLTDAAKGLSGGKYFKTIAIIPISGTDRMLGVSDDYKLYKITGAEAAMDVGAAIATLSGNTQILAFAGYAVLCDGGYLKYYDNSAVNIAYDDGTGTRGYMFNHLTDDNDASAKLYTGSILKIGNQETTAAFGAGYTIPTTKIRVWLSKLGSPTGTAQAHVWDNTGTSLGSSSNTVDVSTLSTNAAVFDFEFAAGTSLSQSTAYLYGIEYTSTSSDINNCVNVFYDTVASGGVLRSYTVAGGWTVADTTKSMLVAIKPGLPPKADFGCVAHNRLHLVDSSYKGKLQISAPGGESGGMFDWCTPTLAGYVNSIDDDANSYPIGAVAEKYGDIWIWGKAKQSYLARLSGTSPDDWVIKLTGQEIYTSYLSIQDTIDDLFFASKLNCHSLAGSDQYGDVRAGGIGNPIKNLFEDYWTTSAFSGYWGNTGQYFIYLPSYGTLVCHTKDLLKRWTRYTYKSLTESAYFGTDSKFYVACTNGHLYRLSSTLFADAGTAYDITLEGGIVEFPFGEMELVKIYQMMPTSGVTTATLHIYPNGSSTAKRDLSVAAGTVPQGTNCRMNAKSLKIKLDTVAFTATTHFGAIIIRARRLYGLGQR